MLNNQGKKQVRECQNLKLCSFKLCTLKDRKNAQYDIQWKKPTGYQIVNAIHIQLDFLKGMN